MGLAWSSEKCRLGNEKRASSQQEQVIVCEMLCLSEYLISLEATATRDPFAGAYAPLSIL